MTRNKDPNILLLLVFEVNLDKHFISRENFTLLDLMGDLGGLKIGLISASHFILILLNYGYFD